MTEPLPLIETSEARGRDLTVVPSSAFRDRFGGSEFRATFSGSGVRVPLEELSEGVALIPFVANVLPVLWLSGEVWSVDRLDTTFTAAMTELRATYRDSYPGVPWDGVLKVGEPDEPVASPGAAQDLVLFSGGVDSFYTSLCGTDRRQILATVWGSDVDLSDEESWSALRASTSLAAQRAGHDFVFVRSNFRKFLDVPRLERHWPSIGDWWSHIQHGPGLLGLVAPIAPQGVGARTFIAASHTETFEHAWGSAPGLDECMSWGDVQVIHHGYDASRQQKVGLIAATSASMQIELRVCYSNTFAGGRNCTRCEKCLRTAAAIMAEGAEPASLGMDVQPETVVRRIERNFRWFLMPISHNEVFMWTDVQRRLRVALSAGSPAPTQMRLAPLLEIELARYRDRVQRVQAVRKRVIRLVRRFPSLEVLAKRLRAGVRRLLP